MRDRVLLLSLSAVLLITCFAPTMEDPDIGRLGEFRVEAGSFPSEMPKGIFAWQYTGEVSTGQVASVFSDRLKGFPRTMAEELADHVVRQSKKHGFSPALVLALIEAESSFTVKVRSHKGAMGLMQLLPSTAQYIASRNGIEYRGRRELLNPFKNIEVGVAYLAYLRDRYQGNMTHFLGAYNAGPGRINRVMRGVSRRPTETVNYVKKITARLPKMKSYGRRSDSGDVHPGEVASAKERGRKGV
jgi:hypothetical protein